MLKNAQERFLGKERLIYKSKFHTDLTERALREVMELWRAERLRVGEEFQLWLKVFGDSEMFQV